MRDMAYSVLLVDDEEEAIRVIMDKIDWEGLGFTIAGHAGNGVLAMEMAEECQPDVVMTDIKMPYMDGLELARRLKHEYPAVRILLCTGFDEFEYAKEAVHLEVEEYLLKPVNAQELTESFKRLRKSLDEERAEKQNVRKLQNYYMESLPLLQANFYSSLIDGRISKPDIPKYINDYQIDLTGPVLCCVDIHTSASDVPEGMTPLLLSMSVQREAQERLGKAWRARFFTYLTDTIMIAQMENGAKQTELTDDCDRFSKTMLRLAGAKVTCGIGDVCEDIGGLRDSYSGAREAVSYRVLYGTGRAISIMEIAPKEKNYQDVGDSGLHKLLKEIHTGTPEEIKSSLTSYFDETLAGAKSIQQYHAMVMELLGAMYRFAAMNDIDTSGEPGAEEDKYDRLLQMDRTELRDKVIEKAIFFHNSLSSARSSQGHSLVQDARDYVRDHYDNPALSLDLVCRTLGLSNSYFSSLFKKETGQSFVQYLTGYRMEQAARLLLESSEKSYVIGRRVGYEDANYFSYVFKRTFGRSPSRYRSEHMEQRG